MQNIDKKTVVAMNFFEKALSMSGFHSSYNSKNASDETTDKQMILSDDNDDAADTDDDITDTEDDSGIAEEPPDSPLDRNAFPELNIADAMSEQGSALNNFFHYW